MPTLTELLERPELVERVSSEDARGLLARLAALQAPLLARALATPATETKQAAEALLLVPEAAARLGLPVSYLYELIRLDRVEAVRIGPKYVRVHPATVAAIQRDGLDKALSHPYSSRRDGQGAARASRRKDARALRQSARRSLEHAGAVRARRALDSRTGGPPGDDLGT
jgi:excisionase family DNA binding protein